MASKFADFYELFFIFFLKLSTFISLEKKNDKFNNKESILEVRKIT